MSELPPPILNCVVPLFNKKDTVVRTIRSIKSQTLNNFSCVIVNNNSTDHPDEAVLAEIADDARFSYVNCEAQGVAHSRNAGLLLGEAPYCCCIDSDDEVKETYLEICVNALRSDPSLGIAYSKLEAVHPDGSSVVSAWPGVYDFNATLRKKNQVPTAAVFRREAWVRAGGYRQRYAPEGAGAEDADLWLRIGLLGYGGILATTEPLFRYYLGGIVSGNPDYKEVAWLDDKGYIAKGELPFAAPSMPANRISHPVRQYDDPTVSVVVPVGPGHVWTVWDALDSVEAQNFRQWELIVVQDSPYDKVTERENQEWERLKKAFPFARFHQTSGGPKGAGYARNLGAKVAKAPLLLFLDADDWLVPTAIDEMVTAYNQNPDTIIYSDYIGHAYLSKDAEGTMLLEKLKHADRLIDLNKKTGEAKIRYHAFPYDCQRAQQQPQPGKDPYIWNVVSSLVPREYHDAIGGFDENMDSWEDYDYWVRLAKAGYCFIHLDKPLLEYRFYTGKRRSLANPGESGESGRQLSTHLLEYMQGKYREIENMPCSGCGGGRKSVIPPMPVNMMMQQTLNEGGRSMSADDMITVKLNDGNLGDHLIAFQGTSYGYRVHGDEFSMKRAHAQLDRRVIIVNDAAPAMAMKKPAMQMTPPPPPVADDEDDDDIDNGEAHKASFQGEIKSSQGELITKNTRLRDEPLLPTTGLKEAVREEFSSPGPPTFDFSTLWGVDEKRADLVLSRGIRTLDGLIMYGPAAIAKLFDIPEATGKRIIMEAEKVLNPVVSTKAIDQSGLTAKATKKK